MFSLFLYFISFYLFLSIALFLYFISFYLFLSISVFLYFITFYLFLSISYLGQTPLHLNAGVIWTMYFSLIRILTSLASFIILTESL